MDRGCTPTMVLEYCRLHNLGAAVVHNEEVVESIPGKPVLAFTVHEPHCYFYESKAVCTALAARKKGGVQRLKKEQRQSTTPAYKEWKIFEYEVATGITM